MPKVTIQGLGDLNFPDSMTPEQIQSAIESDILPKLKSGQWNPLSSKPYSPVDEMSPTERFRAGFGGGMVTPVRGAGQLVGLVSNQDVAAARGRDAPLTNTTAGALGNFGGTITAAAPTMLIPGANTAVGAAAIGGGLGALEPTTADESRLGNIAKGTILGGVGQRVLGKIAGSLESRLSSSQQAGVAQAAKNAVLDATQKTVQDAGYVLPPSLAGGNVALRLAEGLAGKAKTNQLAAGRNQDVTQAAARDVLGLGPLDPLSREAAQNAASRAYNAGYKPIENIGPIPTDEAFTAALDKIAANRVGAARSFPLAKDNGVNDVANQLRVPSFESSDAVAMIRNLREDADSAFSSGNKALGQANKDAAKALEDQIERHLEGGGQDSAALLKAFRDARTQIAQAKGVERSITPGSSNVDAGYFGSRLAAGKPIPDQMKPGALMAQNYGEVAGIPKAGWSNPLTVLDYVAGLGSAVAHPLAGLAFPAARIGTRYGILSGPVQKAMADKSYGPGLLDSAAPQVMRKLEELGLMGALPSIYSQQ